MKKIILCILFVFSLALIASCGNDQRNNQAAPSASGEASGAAPSTAPSLPQLDEPLDNTIEEKMEDVPENKIQETSGQVEAIPFISPVAGESQMIAGLASLPNKIKYVLKKVNGSNFKPIGRFEAPWIEIHDKSKLFGKVCNSFRGPVKITNGQLQVHPLAATLMACGNDEMAKMEHLIFEMLEKGAKIEVNNSSLTLSFENKILFFEAS